MGKEESRLMVQLYTDALKLAAKSNQCVGEKNEYYVTLEQLNELIHDRLVAVAVKTGQ